MSSNRDAPVGIGIYVIALAGLAYLVVILVQLPGASRRGDFSIYYACAVAMHRGLDPYAIDMRTFTREERRCRLSVTPTGTYRAGTEHDCDFVL